MSAAPEPMSASTFMNLAKPSIMNEPPGVAVLVDGMRTTVASAIMRKRSAKPVTRGVERSPRKAPTSTSTSAPTASTISGRAGPKAGAVRTAFIARDWSLLERQERRGLRREGALGGLDKGVRGGREGVEERPRLGSVIDNG